MRKGDKSVYSSEEGHDAIARAYSSRQLPRTLRFVEPISVPS